MSTRRRTGGWCVVLPDGQRHPVARTLLVGRDASADGQWPGADLLSVIDTTNTVSKTHAVLEVDASGIWITDLNSTNGVFIELPSGDESDIIPAERTQVAAGSTIVLGDFELKLERE